MNGLIYAIVRRPVGDLEGAAVRALLDLLQALLRGRVLRVQVQGCNSFTSHYTGRYNRILHWFHTCLGSVESVPIYNLLRIQTGCTGWTQVLVDGCQPFSFQYKSWKWNMIIVKQNLADTTARKGDPFVTPHDVIQGDNGGVPVLRQLLLTRNVEFNSVAR